MDERAVPVSAFHIHRATSVPPPPKLTLSALTSLSSSARDDLSAVMKPIPSPNSYTSLKDLIPSFNANSPRPTDPAAQDEAQPFLLIRNRLVMRAAWAYLRPMSTSPGSDGGGFLLGRVWRRVVELVDGMRTGIAWVVEWALRVVRMRSSV